MDSSAALREYSAIQDGRLADPAQRFEQWYLDFAELLVKTVASSPGRKRVRWFSGGRKARMETIDWEAIDLEKNEYVLELQASSIFALTPAAAKDELERQLATQQITPEEYRRLLAHPDLETEQTIQAAAADDIDRVIELLEDGKYEDPQEFQDLVNGAQRISLALLNLNQYSTEDEPHLLDVKMNMINWLASARAILEEATQPMQPPDTQSQMAPTPMMPQPGVSVPPTPGF